MLQVSNLMQENAKLKKQVEEKEEKEKQFMEERRDLLLKHRNQEKTLDDKTSDSKSTVQKKPDLRQVQRGSSKRAFGLADSGAENADESKVQSSLWTHPLQSIQVDRLAHDSPISRNKIPVVIGQNKLQRCNSL